jgi:DNA-binding NtrC family response regulator
LRLKVRQIAKSPVPAVLLQGETGTGKEVVARAIHHVSERCEGPLVSVNCAALTETLLMSELFGHEKGAFTGALQRRKGVFETAHGGTLFLDEISEMGVLAQAALLRVLEQRTITRVGGVEEIPVNVRIIAATNGSIPQLIKEGRFREDLYYRLNIVQVSIPPLRERGEDIIVLANHFLNRLATSYEQPRRMLTPEVEALLCSYPWPGNVRELRNVFERLYVFGDKQDISSADLPSRIRLAVSPAPRMDDNGIDHTDALFNVPFQLAKQIIIERFEQRYLKYNLARESGNISRAAERSGMIRQSFQRLMSRYDLVRECYLDQRTADLNRSIPE